MTAYIKTHYTINSAAFDYNYMSLPFCFFLLDTCLFHIIPYADMIQVLVRRVIRCNSVKRRYRTGQLLHIIAFYLILDYNKR